ncbi:MAG: SOS response-associated peptidase [Myxococcota bacterium]
MCGRFSLAADPDLLRDELGVEELPEELAPRYNIAPTQPAAVVTNRAPRRVRLHRFGLVPHWAKDPSVGNRMINARRESLADKPAFRDAYAHRRCLVLADGFYEWRRQEGRKQPYFIHFPEKRPFGFAGLWALWRAPDGQTIPSCAIVTAPARGRLKELHDRMPVIVPRDLRAEWLDPEPRSDAELQPLLDATPVDALEARPVSTYVNSPDHEGARCIAPLQ